MEKLVTGRTTTSYPLYIALYKAFYGEMWRTARIILTILSVPLFVAGFYWYFDGFGYFYVITALVAAIMFVVYPRNAYRRSAKQMKGTVQTVHFAFYADHMTEKCSGETENYNYSSVYSVIETKKYFFIFHGKESVSALDKKEILTGSEEILRSLLKNNCKKYRFRKKI